MRIQQTLSKISRAEDLPDTTLVVIGLWNMGYTDLELIGQLLQQEDLGPLRRLCRMLRTTRNPLIRRFVDVGLPPGVYRPFPAPVGPNVGCLPCESRDSPKIKCPICHRMVDYVPCPFCSIRGCHRVDGLHGDRHSHPYPVGRTGAAPGSAAKIAVLRERLRRGEQLFHCKDKKLPKPE